MCKFLGGADDKRIKRIVIFTVDGRRVGRRRPGRFFSRLRRFAGNDDIDRKTQRRFKSRLEDGSIFFTDNVHFKFGINLKESGRAFQAQRNDILEPQVKGDVGDLIFAEVKDKSK